MKKSINAQKVFNVYPHLADGTLPPDLWDESAELAAMVYLAVQYPARAAYARLRIAVKEYNCVNRLLGLPELPFDSKHAKHKLTAVSRYISSLPNPVPVGTVYKSLLLVAFSNPDWDAAALNLATVA